MSPPPSTLSRIGLIILDFSENLDRNCFSRSESLSRVEH
jgi:hypothetical protein